jgi:2-phospho-L-lactate guanylyltransferase
MKAILIPVKEFRRSKERLAPHFSEDERASLAEALCEDMFNTVAQVNGVNSVYVVSREQKALALARKNGWETIAEAEQISESHSVDAASRYCTEQGVTALLRLPIDIPLATASDIEALWTALEPAPCAVLVPSRDGAGTNALLRAPPTLFPSHFGPNSFALHLEAAERCGARTKIVRSPQIALDVDEPADLAALRSELKADCATARWLKQHARKIKG